ncbi:hypothetical protein COV53_04205 [Candidatus Gottesmanbacteria bacterium CG11_big_fil_rev_8_21_14_0_20_37_11]|uniref:Glycosyltransferase RgtA/B/C/D-like domain-containing protein n=3 Tax=Candidatus Gottesmaniibacteriota TaxID=1752720 RepID=A0A2M7RQA8_9BACT|nr:MAG: hypothetical protein AUJ73_02850 [Candidatus Gottesmanbacteria bacterium CG1_02_37_22]PIP32746.1 MAG: hypothetical protein COX23_02880 [Candidatus Gottesmanbacteria bacterium CG23_combo_of_CG06-09_8_20_14_all_37_19]PIR08205.1 MAG: hypothetical protein COV53_04205 [Candidatus Gottesmanbacteria bacterium CG11_big_fil_rev_8_21_14_0_20_37_11]PIZ02452.1 MAG: hypothetical protein COY59_04595 [Candidatus Gottesmanbacteria bacterium CG_4_10_14_0_8_um_filter_37_24]
MRKIIQRIIFILIIISIIKFIYLHENYFTRPFDPKYFGELYSNSQYVIGERSVGGIGDDGLYAFAGYYYLFQGGDVSAVNFEHPPLGKYLIGISILIFNNQNVINVIYYLFILFLTYKIGQILIKDNMWSMLSVAVIALDPLIQDNLIRSLLDLPFSLFFVASVYFYILGLKKPKYLFLSNLFLGMTFSVRFFPSIIFIYGYLLFIIFIKYRGYLKTYIKSSLLIPVIYLVSHLSFFIYHPSFVEFLRHKKWMLSWFTGTPAITGNIWRNIFTGKYISSTGKLLSNAYWIPVIPILTFMSIIPRKMFMKQKYVELGVIYGVVIINLIYVTFLTNGIQKFIMPIYPFIVIIAVNNLLYFYSIISSCRKTLLKK